MKRKRLLPEKILFAVDGPNSQGPRHNAYDDIVGNLRDMGATVLAYDEKDAIMRFVKNENAVGRL